MEDIRMLAVPLLGVVAQWAFFGPKNFPNWAAWGIVIGAGTALYFWFTPTAPADFANNWRIALYDIAMFIAAIKGSGSTVKALGGAPATNSL